MEIDANMNSGAVNSPLSVKKTPSTPAAVPEIDSFESSNALQEALQNTPDVRSDAVAKGQALVNDKNYPSGDTVKKLSSFLATQLPSIPD